MKNAYYKLKSLSIILLLIVSTLFTTAQVNVNLNIIPPYSPFFRDYMGYLNNKTVVTLFYTNPAAMVPIQVYLSASIRKDDNSVTVQVKDSYKPNIPITLVPNIPQTLTGTQLRNIFGNGTTNDLILTGMSLNETILNQALKEGNYSICIKVKDYNTGNLIAESCSSIYITYCEPPQIFSPLNNSIETAKTPQNILISWTPTTPAVLGVNYRLRILKLMNGISATDALNYNTQVIFEKSDINRTSYPLDLASGVKLDTGSVYVMQVTASSSNALIKNGGKSEPVQFMYKAGNLPPVIIPPIPNNEPEKPNTQLKHLKVYIPYCEESIDETLKNKLKIKTNNNKVIEVNNTHHFYLRWEDLANSMVINNNDTNNWGVIYKIQIFSTINQKMVWEKLVWNDAFYEQAIGNLPFLNKQDYKLYIQAYKGKKEGDNLITDTKFAESYQCNFTYSILNNVANLINYQVSGKLLYHFQNDTIDYPVNSSGVVLKKYFMIKDSITDKILVNDLLTLNTNTSTTVKVNLQENGSFTSNFMAHPNAGYIGIQELLPSYEYPYKVKGRGYEYYKLEINSPYYLNPKTIIELANDSLVLGEIKTKIWSYTLNAEISKGYYNSKTKKYSNFNELNPKNLKVLVHRVGNTSIFADLPYYEGDMKSETPKINTYDKTVSKGKVITVIGKDGKARTVVVVDNLICNQLQGDVYKISITQDTVIAGKTKTYLCGDLYFSDIKYTPTVFEKALALTNNKTNFQYNTHGTLLTDDPPKSTLTGQLVYRDPNDPKSVIKPLANTQVSLIVTYLIEDSKGNKTILDPYHVKEELSSKKNEAIGGMNTGQKQAELLAQLVNPFGDGNTPLATDVTDMEGKFIFKDFANIDSLGYSNASGEFGGGSGEFSNYANFNGKLQRTVRVVMSGTSKSKWFNPANNINIQPNDSLNVGVLTAYLKTYKLTIVPRSAPENKNVLPLAKVVQGSKIKIVKKGIYLQDPDITDFQYVDTKNGCDFSIPMHDKSILNDDVKINISTSDSVGENSFATRNINFPRGYEDWKRDLEFQEGLKNNSCDPDGSGYFTTQKGGYNRNKRLDGMDSIYFQSASDYYYIDSDYKPVSVNVNAYLEPNLPIISGRVLDATNTMRSVDEGTVRLIVSDKNGVSIQKRNVSESNKNGYFNFTNLTILDGYDGYDGYSLNVKAKGYTLLLAKQLKNKSSNQYNINSTLFGLGNSAQNDTIVHTNSGNGNIPSGDVKLKPKMGQQISFPQILMMPNASINAWVYNEKKQAVPAFVKTTRSILKKTNQKIKSYFPTINGQYFELNIPSGYQDTLFVLPEDLSYFNDTIIIPFMPNGAVHLDDIIVKDRLHRIEIIVKDVNSNKAIAGAKVKILDYENTTNALGKAVFTFKNITVKNFWYQITPPDNSDYIQLTGEITNYESKNMVSYTLKMKKGAEVTGIVTSGGRPVPSAEVWVNNGNNVRKVITDATGKYSLKGISVSTPFNKSNQFSALIKCNAPADTLKLNNQNNIEMFNLIGEEKLVLFPNQSSIVNLNFNLQVFNDANISRLHGFLTHVTKLNKLSNGNIQISGTLDLNKCPSNFQLIESSDQNPSFENLITKPDLQQKDAKGRPYLEANPEQSEFALNMPSLKVRLLGTNNTANILSTIISPSLYNYNVKLENTGNSYLKITKLSTTSGSIISKAHIVDNSFNFPGSHFNFSDNQFYLAEKQNNNLSTLITSFKSTVNESTNMVFRQTFSSNRNYTLMDNNGKNLKFKFLNFNADSKISSSYITNSGTIVLKPNAWTLNPLLKKVGIIDTIMMNLPEIGITADGINTGGSLVNQINIKFEKWNIVARNCEIGPEVGGIHSSNTEIQTGTLNIPIQDFTLRSDLIYMSKPQLKTLKLGGIWDMKIIKPDDAQFGLDPKVGKDLAPHYKLCFVGDPAATVSNLPGFGGDLVIQAVSLLSNGEQIVSFAPNCQNIKLYNVADFKPVAIYSYADNFNIDGVMDFGIPRISNELTYKLLFEKSGNGLKMKPVSQNISFEGPGNVKFESLATNGDKQFMFEDNLELYGTVKEEGALDPIRIILRKIRVGNAFNYNISINLDRITSPNTKQFIKFGTDANASKFQIDKSDMIVKNKDWDYLRLQLQAETDFAKNSGFGSNSLNMIVLGEIKSDPDVKNQTINISKSDSPFGDFTLIYDKPNNQMIGNINIQNKKMGGIGFGGAAEISIGSKGFYFAGTGTASVTPFGDFSAGILVGSYHNNGILGGIPATARDLVTRFSIGKEFPCAIVKAPEFNGFFVTGRKNLPIVSINESVNVFIASASVYTDIGFEASAWGVKANNSLMVGVSGMLYGIAELKLSSITCTTLTASAHINLKGQAEILYSPAAKTATLEANADMSLAGSINQDVPTLYGCGPSIFSFGGEFIKIHAGIKASVDLAHPLSTPKFDYSLGVGSSANPVKCE